MSGQYEFEMRVTAKDLSGYYYPRWDAERATKLTVIAANRDEAFKEAFAVMGTCPRGRDWTWTAKIDRIRAVTS